MLNTEILDKVNILGLNSEKLRDIFSVTGLKKFNADQVYDWLHNKLVFDFDKFTNISKKDRELLKKNFYLPTLEYKTHQISDDGDTEKFLFELKDGKLIESVLISHKNRHTLCISSQIGCLLGCDFCATATMRYERNLDVSEILIQFYFVQNYLKKYGKKLDNSVFMGMGEPFLNYDNVIEAVNILNSHKGQNFSKRNFTISTSGIIPGINKFTENENQINLAISLHSVKDDIRTEIMPINKKYKVKELKKALVNYQKKTKNRITFEYILIDDLNCEAEDASELADFLRSFSCMVNLIPYNKVIGKPYKTPSNKKQRNFYSLLKEKNVNVTLRETKGQDIAAACGQLKVQKEMENGK
ncbi:23S rRNA (adenine(2503)-C(2))-methyltransferase RlmN [Leptotrichia sp. OH3620_COT-345]|uniref:23S rRNA (adenine(2503)-C(2))-methyltransferase RlmN n=1 Tax=Leptotrichia sp. OH3620_COT-345 TaxID=2491048 RepID=UPI000F652EDA|nr:23S rRNA (adenine(2503)-C(2))-methyltransferase RlmN [Leptotrichia sp. OH3620_COT-345]RRD39056.1 23S rRNA (adenine(2503)-C(2))-methyltransferase RlmN [Leptotrichia sp. OH3620_COT-345]